MLKKQKLVRSKETVCFICLPVAANSGRVLESEKGSQQTRLEYITGLSTPQRLWLSLLCPPSSYRT